MGRKRTSAVIGKWRIVEADLWSAEHLDLVEPAYIRFDADGRGEFVLICVNGSMDCSYDPGSAGFTWVGFDEMDETGGSGDAEVGDDGLLTIELSFHNGDDAVLKARRW